MHTQFYVINIMPSFERLSAILVMKCSRKLEGSEGQIEYFYFNGINSLTEKCHKCSELSRDYIGK